VDGEFDRDLVDGLNAAGFKTDYGHDMSGYGKKWGLDHENELRNMWRPTSQPGLWFHAGSLYQCRVFSKYLALQIAAQETGLVKPPRPA
jgi:hypothetical protein